jgi:menaquinone-dependent protoporphyrinogen oxidase
MARILVAFSTVDGQTRRICERLRDLLEAAGHAAILAEIRDGADIDVAACDKVVVGASIRYGHHRRAVHAFVARHRARLVQGPSAFFSVNLVARKPGKDAGVSNPYVRAFLRRSDWAPTEQAAFAGRVDYPRYRFVDRQVIRLIMWLTDGPTDPAARIEYTDWAAVEAFARRVAAM